MPKVSPWGGGNGNGKLSIEQVTNDKGHNCISYFFFCPCRTKLMDRMRRIGMNAICLLVIWVFSFCRHGVNCVVCCKDKQTQHTATDCLYFILKVIQTILADRCLFVVVFLLSRGSCQTAAHRRQTAEMSIARSPPTQFPNC